MWGYYAVLLSLITGPPFYSENAAGYSSGALVQRRKVYEENKKFDLLRSIAYTRISIP
jgi:hypothetical protein